MTLQDAGRRALRTFIDAAIGTFLLLITLPQFVSEVGGQPIPDFGTLDTVLIACGWSGIIAVLNWVKNLGEDSTGHAFLVAKHNPDPEATHRAKPSLIEPSEEEDGPAGHEGRSRRGS